MSAAKRKQPEIQNWHNIEDATPTTQLETFRKEWLEELKTKSAGSSPERAKGKGSYKDQNEQFDNISVRDKADTTQLDIALDTYIQGCKQERNGRLFEATLLYRKAIKMDSNVEQRYRVYLQSQPVDLTTSNDDRSRTKSTDAVDIVDLAQKIENTHLKSRDSSEWLTESVPGWGEDSILNQLPIEVVERLVSWVIYLDIAAVSILATTCRQMALLLQRPSIWKFLSEKAHDSMPVDMLSDESRRRFDYNWFAFYLDRPRIRRDGVYISKVEYLRTGYSDTFLQPIHVVTYYRYIRFFPGNVCLVLTTLLEPANVVRDLDWDTCQIRGIMRGVWKWEDYNALVVECVDEARSTSTMFQYRFSVSQSKRGRQNRLNWILCSSYDLRKKNDDPYIFPSTQLRSFHFSRVKSFRPFH